MNCRRWHQAEKKDGHNVSRSDGLSDMKVYFAKKKNELSMKRINKDDYLTSTPAYRTASMAAYRTASMTAYRTAAAVL